MFAPAAEVTNTWNCLLFVDYSESQDLLLQTSQRPLKKCYLPRWRLRKNPGLGASGGACCGDGQGRDLQDSSGHWPAEVWICSPLVAGFRRPLPKSSASAVPEAANWQSLDSRSILSPWGLEWLTGPALRLRRWTSGWLGDDPNDAVSFIFSSWRFQTSELRWRLAVDYLRTVSCALGKH